MERSVIHKPNVKNLNVRNFLYNPVNPINKSKLSGSDKKTSYRLKSNQPII